MTRSTRLLSTAVALFLLVCASSACGSDTAGSAATQDGQATDQTVGETSWSGEPLAAGLFPCGDVAESADNSLSVEVMLPDDLTAAMASATVAAPAGAAPVEFDGYVWVQAVDADGRVVTYSDMLSAVDFPAMTPTPGGSAELVSTDRAPLPCPGTDESDIAGWIAVVSEHDGDRRWISEPVPAPAPQE